jgi:hypothetical protein
MTLEIKKLYCWRSRVTGQPLWVPVGLNLKDRLWWRFMPGVMVTVRWPSGRWHSTCDVNGGMTSTWWVDPNNYYRPWMEANVGRQGWDWDWGYTDAASHDVSDYKLTIKIRRKHAAYATIMALKWA